MDVKSHWDQVFASKAPEQVSWYQAHLRLSLELLQQSGIDRTARIIDVGAGDSTFVDHLLDLGFSDVSVFDVSPAALQRTRERLGERSRLVTWLEAALLSASLPESQYDLWHDRALFHFLIEAQDRQVYTNTAFQTLRPGGHLTVATIAIDGPEACSGLRTRRYSPKSLQEEFGEAFELLDSRRENHRTPRAWKSASFTVC